MLKQLLLATVFAAATSPAAFAMSDAECSALMNKPGVYTSTTSNKLSAPYADAFVKSGGALSADGTMDQAKFVAACKSDAFKLVAMAPEPGAPFAGANSYTEQQAINHIEKAGFTGVTGLKKDDQGIWRATAMRAGKPVSIALDFKGNVVAN